MGSTTLTRAALVASLALATACFAGSALKRDSERLRKQCGVVLGSPIGEEQARCVARLWGVLDRKECPMEVDRPGGYDEPVFRVRESCNGLGVVVEETTARVVALVGQDGHLTD